MKATARALAAVLVAGAAAGGGTAPAVQDVVCTAQAPCPQDFTLQIFDPAIGRDRYLTVAGPGVLKHLSFDLGFFMDYQHKPLSVFLEEDGSVGTEEVTLVKSRIDGRVLAALGLLGRFQVGLDVPITFHQTGQYFDTPDGESAPTTGIADPRVELKAQILGNAHGPGLAFAPVLTIPAAGGEGFSGSDNLSVTPRVLAGYRDSRWGVGAEAGYLVREETEVLGSSVDDQILYGVGVGFDFTPRVGAVGEFHGRHGLNKQLAEAPAEVDAAIEFEIVSDVRLQVGGGSGVVQGLGAPPARGFLQVRWSPDTADTDGDGIKDKVDECKTEREDRDNWKDLDGCPETDNDEDLLPDLQDRCPNSAEDKDGFQDDDGCPEADNDKDGLPDTHDECPMKPGPKESAGCPPGERDKDEDGIFDATDKCIDDPEDKDGFEDEDGCPEPDNDKDGVPDALDDCPLQAEDADGFKDEDGCPEPDNDSDGVLDGADQCPTEPETINGNKDDDGCPDEGEAKAILQGDQIVILEQVNFKTGTAKIVDKSKPLLGQVALIVKANPDVKKVRVEGHTDDRGDDRKNMALSQKRAEAVRTQLIAMGVAAERLEAQGLGETRPIADNKKPKGRAANRRVEFHLVEEQPAGAPPQ